MSVVVTGATGHLGRLIVESLLTRGADAASILASGRATEKLAGLAARGVRTARVDFNDPESLSAAFSGAETLVLVSGTEFGKRAAQHAAAIDAAKSAGVRRVIYTSAPAATTTTLILAPEHKATEEYLHASSMTYTILRNNWYNENYLGTLEQAKATGSVVTSTGDGRVASAARADFAEAAAVVALGTDHDNRTYELSGDTAWTASELVAAISHALGRDIEHRRVSTAEHVEILVGAGLDEGTAGFVAGIDANIAEGVLGVVSTDLVGLIGRPTTPLVETLRAAV